MTRPTSSTTNSYLKESREREEKRARKQTIGLFALLCVLLPPVGLIVSLRSRRTGLPTRVALAALAFVVMTAVGTLLFKPENLPGGLRPTPVAPVTVGYGTQPEPTATAEPAPIDYGSEEIIGDYDYVYDVEGDLPVDPAANLDIVYAVTNNATLYHTQQVCDMQTNNRRLLLEDALAEGLLPCEKCCAQE